MDAIVLSGGHRDIERRLGHPTKSLIEFNEISTLDIVLREVVESDCISSIVVIGPKECEEIIRRCDCAEKPVRWVESPVGNSMFQNLMYAYRYLLNIEKESRGREIFFACSDIPFISSEIVSEFISDNEGTQLTAIVPIVSLSSCRKVEQKLGVKIPSVENHSPIALDGQLYHLGNIGLLQPETLSKYWLEALCLSRDAREIQNVIYSLVDPKRIKLIFHLFSGFLKQNRSKNLPQLFKFSTQLLNWVVSSYFFSKGSEEKAQKYALRVKSHFLFQEFFPNFGLNVKLAKYNKPEVFLDFDLEVDVEFLYENHDVLKNYFSRDVSIPKNSPVQI